MHDQQRYVFFYTLLYKIVLVNFDYLSGYLITLNYFKMIPILVESFPNLH